MVSRSKSRAPGAILTAAAVTGKLHSPSSTTSAGDRVVNFSNSQLFYCYIHKSESNFKHSGNVINIWFILLLLFFFSFRYLQEIGYTDTIIDVRSNRVRSLLGLNNNANSADEHNRTPALNGNENQTSDKRPSDSQVR